MPVAVHGGVRAMPAEAEDREEILFLARNSAAYVEPTNRVSFLQHLFKAAAGAVGRGGGRAPLLREALRPTAESLLARLPRQTESASRSAEGEGRE